MNNIATTPNKDSLVPGPISGGKSSQRISREMTPDKRLHNSQPSLKYDGSRQSQKSKRSIRLSNLMAAMYPGVHVGHKHCVPQITMVPKTMGWLWNSEDKITGPFPRGYRPGAIALGVKKRYFPARSIAEPMATPIGSKGKKIKKKIKHTSSSVIKSSLESYVTVQDKELPPTLLVRKEKGVYKVTMQPINPFAQGEEEPVQFKIAEDSASSVSGTSKSSSTIKIEYLCTGARRKPIIKPEIIEMSTQWDLSDLPPPPPTATIEKPKKEESLEKAPTTSKKKGKVQLDTSKKVDK